MSPLRIEPTDYPGWYRVYIYDQETRPVYIPSNHVQRFGGSAWLAYGIAISLLVLCLIVLW